MATFVRNKYYRWYCEIIKKSKARVVLPDLFEKHHIVPRCMEGADNKDNIAFLTFKEHFIVHWLLTKCVSEKYKSKMIMALAMMGNIGSCNKKRNISSWQFVIARKSSRAGQLGHPVSLETRKKISLGNKGRSPNKALRLILSERLKGVPLSEERRLKMMFRSPTLETREKLRTALQGRKRPKEVIEKIRASHLLLNKRRREERNSL